MRHTKKKNKIKTSNVVLIIMALLLIAFTVAVLWIFVNCQQSPDVLITSVFAAALSECGFLAWIRNTKSKYGDDDTEIIEEE